MENHLNLNKLNTKDYKWLKKSDFYRSLKKAEEDEEDESENESENLIPIKFCSKKETDIKIFFDVIKLWMIDYLPKEFYLLLKNDTTNFIDYIKNLEETSVSDLFKFLIIFKDLSDKNNIKAIYEESTTYKRLDCLKFLLINNKLIPGEKDKNLCNIAAKNGDLDSFLLCFENGQNIDNVTATIACYGGNLEILKFSHEQGSLLLKKSSIYASLNGHLKCIKYLHENNCEIDKDVYKFAASNGHLHILEYTKKIKVDIGDNYNATSAAVLYGYNKCFYFLFKNKFLSDKWTCMYAVQGKNHEIINFLFVEGIKYDYMSYQEAIKNNDLETIKLLHSYDVDFSIIKENHLGLEYFDIELIDYIVKNFGYNYKINIEDMISGNSIRFNKNNVKNIKYLYVNNLLDTKLILEIIDYSLLYGNKNVKYHNYIAEQLILFETEEDEKEEEVNLRTWTNENSTRYSSRDSPTGSPQRNSIAGSQPRIYEEESSSSSDSDSDSDDDETSI